MVEEYVLLFEGGEVDRIVTTPLSLAVIQERNPNRTVLRVEDVPLAVLERYPYWSNRP